MLWCSMRRLRKETDALCGTWSRPSGMSSMNECTISSRSRLTARASSRFLSSSLTCLSWQANVDDEASCSMIAGSQCRLLARSDTNLPGSARQSQLTPGLVVDAWLLLQIDGVWLGRRLALDHLGYCGELCAHLEYETWAELPSSWSATVSAKRSVVYCFESPGKAAECYQAVDSRHTGRGLCLAAELSDLLNHKCRGLTEWPLPASACGAFNPVGGYVPACSLVRCCLWLWSSSSGFGIIRAGHALQRLSQYGCKRCNARPRRLRRTDNSGLHGLCNGSALHDRVRRRCHHRRAR